MFTNKVIELIEDNFYIKALKNKSYLEKLKDVIKKELNLETYLTNITTADLSKYKAVAMLEGTSIYLDENAIIEYLKNFEINISPRTITYEYYASILHEIIHIIQQKYLQKRKELKTHEICRLHSELVIQGNISLNPNNSPSIQEKIQAQTLYKKEGILFPTEIEAEIISRQITLEIFDKVYEEYLKEKEELREFYCYLLLEIYDLPSCPLEEFYKLIKREDIFKALNFSEYNIQERCIYGMPITEEEYDTQIEETLKLGI